MQDRDLIVGVLAAQAGFATPSEVLSAAAAGLVDSTPDSLLTRLERTGTLSVERRKILEAMVEQALAARKGDAQAVLESLSSTPTVLETLAAAAAADAARTDGHPATPVAEIPLERPGQYTRLGVLGRGSQSIVRSARDEIVGREVALKELAALVQPAEDDASRAARARFLREARLVASLDHPGIVSIHELARREDGTLFCAQKLIRGETLQARLARCHSLGERLELVRHVLDACQAMGFAHSKHVIHRDLKPSNIMVGEYGETVVVDWGLAKHREEAEDVVPLVASSPEPGLTVAGVALGTPAYMSPEQARGDLAAIDARSDVFSLGAILYQVLTGRPPFEGATSDHILENVRAGNFPPVRTLAPDAPPELAAIAERALRLEPFERYPDAEALAKELSAYLTGGRVGAYQYGTWELLRKFAASHRALTAGIAVALGAVLVLASIVGVRLHLARGALARAFVERARIAESQSDWAMAAGYFAAARSQRDTVEARWGLALAAERAAERILSLEGPPDSFTDVGVLPDGRIVILSATPNRVEVRELDGGKVLWQRDVKVSTDHWGTTVFSQDRVRISRPNDWVDLDAATGKELGVWDRASMGRPCEGRNASRISVHEGKLIARREGQPDVILATDVTRYKPQCAVSGDELQVAYRDTGDRVHLLSFPDGQRLAERPGKGVRRLLFSRHGLILVRQGSIDSMGAPGGDFVVALGESAFTLDYPAEEGGSGLSSDGESVIVSRLGSSKADVVNLRTRSVRAVLHYLPGWPRFAFSADGQRILAAENGRKSQLLSWHLPRDRSPSGHPGSWAPFKADFFPTCCRLAIAQSPGSTIDFYGPEGELLGRDTMPPGPSPRWGLVDDGVFFYLTGDRAILRDANQHRDLWTHTCAGCGPFYKVSRSRTRAAYTSGEGFEIREPGSNRVLFRDTEARGGGPVALSHDGERAAWATTATGHIRNLSSGVQRELTLDGVPERLAFSPDSSQLVALTLGSISVWDTATGRELWSLSNRANEPHDVYWSYDSRSLLLETSSSTLLLDAANGERLVRFPGEPGASMDVRPDLRAMVVVSPTHWDLVPLPQPVDDSPAESLERTLRKTGLTLEGGEIVAAP